MAAFLSWLIATPTLLSFDHSLLAIRYSLPFLPVANRYSPFAAVFGRG
jgi:hypothetical protein